MPLSDPHASCLRCLGEAHQKERCKICKAFKPRTKKERDFRLKQLLMETALQPSTSTAPSASVRSAPASVREPAPAGHPKTAAPTQRGNARRRSSSPAKAKGQSKARGRSPHKRPAPVKTSSAPKADTAPTRTPVVAPAPKGPSSPGMGASSADEGLEELVEQPSTPDTFEAAKDLIALSVEAPARAEGAPPMLPRRGKPAMLRPSRSPSRHRSRNRSRSSSASVDSRLPSTQEASQQSAFNKRLAPTQQLSTSRHREALAVHYPRPSSRSHSRSCDHRYRSRSRSARRYSRSWSRRRYSPEPDRHHSTAPPWPSRSPSVVSGADSDRYGGYAHRPRASRDYGQSQWGQPSQWPFWTPWAYHQQGPPSGASRSGPSGYRSLSPRHRPPSYREATVSRPPEREGVDSAPSTVPSQSHAAGQTAEEQLADAGLLDNEDGQKAPTSSSSPDEAVAGTLVSGPPPIDHRAHQDLLRRVALNLGLQAEETVEQDDPMVDILSPEGPSRVALPIIRTVQSNYKAVWQTPASSAPTAKGVERKYFAPYRGFDFLFLHPSPCSLVVSAVNEKERHGQQAPAPKGKEAKRLDLFGRKVYSSGGLQLRIATQQAILNRHNFNSWASVAKFKASLPPDAHQEFTALVDEGMAVAKTSLQAALDSADAAARTIASGVVMRRSAWLQASGLPPEVQTTLQDLPFEGSGLFSDQTDARLHSLKDSRATLKSLGMHTPVMQRKPFKPQPPQRQYHPRPRHEPYRRRGRDNRRRHNNTPNQGQSHGQGKPQPGNKPGF
ncbi:serine/arginine repetitive matrix protein 2-like isoform X1 [Chrysemys picta bellii]|uniref:serine/arginine repetitive matrix protein 2-like isoform X1 n=1 Tax=Chrysemys picta bellii TaxID=8478 RepID=UPI0032B1E149